ncbi:sigma factor-like helix-turn-helix DNA-binding protein, partial [Pedobacter steynii]
SCFVQFIGGGCFGNWAQRVLVVFAFIVKRFRVFRAPLHLRAMLHLLPDDQKEVLIMRHYADLSFKEIADLTDVSINTALGRMRYALSNLRKMMKVKEIS